ncbi:phosphoribosylformylglycinamidine synthase subunit PurQ [bacterium]|nr:phosphoribosylformylglycinamidine synthase subunit PurQ [bacterium]
MAKLRAIVISGNGVNCEMEMAHANRLAGVDDVRIASIYDLLSGDVRLDDYQLLNMPGGFQDGDDLGSSKAAANRYQHAHAQGADEPIQDQLRRFIDDGKCIIGVCNGFQLLIKLGLLPAIDGKYFQQQATLTFNDRGRFEDRWVRLVVDEQSPCVFTKGMTHLELPVRHGEGKIVPADDDVLAAVKDRHLAPMRYADANGRPTQEYPANPNGSVDAIAALCDETGRVFGVMPHPEAFLHRTNHPRWTREELPEKGAGLAIFRNAVQYLKDSL